MVGQTEYDRLRREWEQYVMTDSLNNFNNQFDFLVKAPTQKQVAQFLVEQDWIEKVQTFTWESWQLSGKTMPYQEFKEMLVSQIIDGQPVNVWRNSYVRNMSRKLTKRIKQLTTTIQSRLNIINSITSENLSDNVRYLLDINSTIKRVDQANITEYRRYLKSLERLQDVENMSQQQINQHLKIVRDYQTDQLTNVQHKRVVEQSFDKVLNFQGKRIAQDQLQRANTDEAENLIKARKSQLESDEVLVGFWTLSPHHKHHYYKGGDPCEKHAEANDGYGKGSHVGYIPLPLKDTHFGCQCKVTFKVEKRK